MKKVVTLCMIYNEKEILLGLKKTSLGKGFYNGFGGKVEEGESIEDATKREVEEEICVKVPEIEKVGILDFYFDNGTNLECHIFKADKYIGTPKETEEMKPVIFPIDQIPYENMWEEDKNWIPVMLSGKKFKGEAYYTDDNKLISQNIKEVVEF